MLNDLDIYNDLPFSADEGWAEMQVLLNKNLAVKKRTGILNAWYASLRATLLCIILLFSFLQLDKDIWPAKQKGSEVSVVTIPAADLVSAKENTAALKVAGRSTALAHINNTAAGNNKLQTTNEFITAAAINYLTQKIRIENISKDIAVNMNGNSIIKTVLINNRQNFPMTIFPGKKEKVFKPWEFAGGIGINMAAGKAQNLQPYPVAEIKYHINPQVFVATGLSLLSPAPGSVTGISKTVYVNDTANNIRLYNENVSYQQLRYADVPVFVGVNLGRKVSLQAGFQASFLLSNKKEKKLQPYDFGMNSVNAYLNPLMGIAASPQEEFDVRLRNIDYRFITGIKYRQNKTTAGLFYQHGLQSAGTGNTAKSSNRLFTLSLLYQIR